MIELQVLCARHCFPSGENVLLKLTPNNSLQEPRGQNNLGLEFFRGRNSKKQARSVVKHVILWGLVYLNVAERPPDGRNIVPYKCTKIGETVCFCFLFFCEFGMYWDCKASPFGLHRRRRLSAEGRSNRLERSRSARKIVHERSKIIFLCVLLALTQSRNQASNIPSPAGQPLSPKMPTSPLSFDGGSPESDFAMTADPRSNLHQDEQQQQQQQQRHNAAQQLRRLNVYDASLANSKAIFGTRIESRLKSDVKVMQKVSFTISLPLPHVRAILNSCCPGDNKSSSSSSSSSVK